MERILAEIEDSESEEEIEEEQADIDADNSVTAVRLRRNQSKLNVAGFGVILFAVWSIIRIIVLYVTNPSTLFTSEDSYDDVVFYKIIVIATVVVVLGFTLLIHFIVGFGARREAQGKKRKGVFYLILDVLLMIFSIYSIFIVIAQVFQGASIVDAVISIFVELTAFITMLELFVAAVKVKHMRKIKDRGER